MFINSRLKLKFPVARDVAIHEAFFQHKDTEQLELVNLLKIDFPSLFSTEEKNNLTLFFMK
jgi:hypothetical protein